MFIATVIAADRLNENALNRVRDALQDCGCIVGENRWIDEGHAADIAFEGDVNAARRATAVLTNDCDIIVQTTGNRQKRLLISDMDSTMIGQECIDELADYAGVKSEVAAITERAMRGELDFAGSLVERVQLLAGLPVATIDQCLQERIFDTPGATTLVATMRARGAATILVSGGFTLFAEPVAQRLGFARAVANVLEVEGNALTGRVSMPIVDAERKRVELETAIGASALSQDDVLAIGDGANDLPMIEAAGLGIAYRAKPVVQARADGAINANDLRALLWAQGLAREQWVDG